MSEQSQASLQIHIQEKKKEKEVKELVSSLVSETNTMGMEKAVVKGIVDGLMGSHRTLQQSFVRALLLACKEIESKGYASDARNEQALKVIKKIAEIDENLPFI